MQKFNSMIRGLLLITMLSMICGAYAADTRGNQPYDPEILRQLELIQYDFTAIAHSPKDNAKQIQRITHAIEVAKSIKFKTQYKDTAKDLVANMERVKFSLTQRDSVALKNWWAMAIEQFRFLYHAHIGSYPNEIVAKSYD